jgi:hypothetical protein
MTPEQLRIFVAVAERQHVTRAYEVDQRAGTLKCSSRVDGQY